jgi:hypothetical protein
VLEQRGVTMPLALHGGVVGIVAVSLELLAGERRELE